MNYRPFLVIPVLLMLGNPAIAQPTGEAREPSPEELDAAFTAQDAAREATAWSDVVIDRSRPDPLERMKSSADLVFRGTVKSQAVVYDENDLPFTQTTFSVTDVLKGAYPGPEFTVVQEGGPAKDDPVNVVMVSDAQYFNEGESDVLFLDLDAGPAVSGQGASIEQRFRVYEGKVYDEHGRGLLLEAREGGKGYRLGLSRDRNPAPRFSQIHVGPHTLTKNFADKDDDPGDSGGDRPVRGRPGARGYQSSVDIATFSAAIRD